MCFFWLFLAIFLFQFDIFSDNLNENIFTSFLATKFRWEESNVSGFISFSGRLIYGNAGGTI